MTRTISVEPIPGRTFRADDLDGRIVDGIEALAQRLRQALLFRARTWFLAATRGLDYDRIISHRVDDELVAQILTDAVREEGGDEIRELGVPSFDLDRASRVFRYRVLATTIYGELQIEEALR